MTPASRRVGTCAAAAAGILAAFALAAGPPAERTLFKELAPADPVREVVQTILGWPSDSVRRGFTDREWAAEGFGGAWARARRYFPDKTYFVRPGTYFMTHGFDAEGRLFMEIHDSDYLELCARNRGTFTAGAIVAAYARMRGADDGLEAAAFRDKVGRLEPFFRDERAARALRRAMGESGYLRFLRELREENYHMLAGGLVHEGAHAGIDEMGLVRRLQTEFREGSLAVQWDELRAFMVEAKFHGAFCRWAAGDIADAGDAIEARLGELETLRKRRRLDRVPDRARYERAVAALGAAAGTVRLRMRELWQSARRLQGLLDHLQADYVRPRAPVGIADSVGRLSGGIADFVGAADERARRTELGLRRLEELLGRWDEWAEGNRPFPPPMTDSKALLAETGQTVWPEPPAAEVDILKKRADEEIGRLAGSSRGRARLRSSR